MAKTVTCYFCGEIREQAVEHIFPRWMRKTFPIEVKARSSYYNSGEFVKKNPGESGTIVSRDVCAICNNGWMSDLQKQARPILEPWLNDQREPLDSAKAEIVSKWIVMTSMSIDAYDEKFIGIPEAERRSFAATQIIPEGWHIYAGTSAGNPNRGWRHSGFLNTDLEAAGQMSIIAFGSAVFFSRSGLGSESASYRGNLGMYVMHPRFDPWIDKYNVRIRADEPIRGLMDKIIGMAPIKPLGEVIAGVLN